MSLRRGNPRVEFNLVKRSGIFTPLENPPIGRFVIAATHGRVSGLYRVPISDVCLDLAPFADYAARIEELYGEKVVTVPEASR